MSQKAYYYVGLLYNHTGSLCLILVWNLRLARVSIYCIIIYVEGNVRWVLYSLWRQPKQIFNIYENIDILKIAMESKLRTTLRTQSKYYST